MISLLLGGCTTFIPTGSEYNLWFAVKKIDGKEQWGVVQDRHVKAINFNDKKVGFIHLSRNEKERGWPYQGKGIGTKILKDVIEEHKEFNIEIQYFKQNPVGKLYERLGFVPNGETEFHYRMIKPKQTQLKK